jgi:hypothetical protein
LNFERARLKFQRAIIKSQKKKKKKQEREGRKRGWAGESVKQLLMNKNGGHSEFFGQTFGHITKEFRHWTAQKILHLWAV